MCHKNQLNGVEYTSPMDGMGISYVCPHVYLYCLNELQPDFHETMKYGIDSGMSNG